MSVYLCLPLVVESASLYLFRSHNSVPCSPLLEVFRVAEAFNQDISSWDVSRVTNMATVTADAGGVQVLKLMRARFDELVDSGLLGERVVEMAQEFSKEHRAENRRLGVERGASGGVGC